MTTAEARAIWDEIQELCPGMAHGFSYEIQVLEDLPVNWLVVPGTLDLVMSFEGKALWDEAALVLREARKEAT